MATVMGSIFIAPELVNMICSYVEISDLLWLMRTSKELHVASSHRIYHTIAISGLRARQLFATIVSSTKNALIYAGAARHLTYRGTSVDDAFLGFPMFASALLKLVQLRTLHITIGMTVSKFLLMQLDKKGVNREFENLFTSLGPLASKKVCVWALPMLTSLTITGDYRLTSLAKCRRLTTFKLQQAIHMGNFADLVPKLLSGHGDINNHLQILELNLRGATNDEIALSFIALAQVFPGLLHLTFRIPYLNPLMIIDIMTDYACYFPKLWTLKINTPTHIYGSWMEQKPVYASPKEECSAFFEKSLRHAGVMREKLTYVQVGTQIWKRSYGQQGWTASSFSIPKTYHEFREFQICTAEKMVATLFSINKKNGQWNWTDGAQESISELMRQSI